MHKLIKPLVAVLMYFPKIATSSAIYFVSSGRIRSQVFAPLPHLVKKFDLTRLQNYISWAALHSIVVGHFYIFRNILFPLPYLPHKKRQAPSRMPNSHSLLCFSTNQMDRKYFDPLESNHNDLYQVQMHRSEELYILLLVVIDSMIHQNHILRWLHRNNQQRNKSMVDIQLQAQSKSLYLKRRGNCLPIR